MIILSVLFFLETKIAKKLELVDIITKIFFNDLKCSDIHTLVHFYC